MDEAQVTSFKAGDILFREGEASGMVLRLLAGVVEIEREAGGDVITLGRVHAGEFIGEMGAIENRPHLATARAATDGAVEVMGVAQFFERIASDPNSALELILRLSARLRNADDELIRAGSRRPEPSAAAEPVIPEVAAPVPVEPPRPIYSVTIAGESPQLRGQLGLDPIPVVERPYVVGRMLEPGEDWPEYEPQLAVKDAKPFLVSRNHFVIESKPGHIIVRDLNSKMGTAVNGQPIGRHFARDSAELKFGPNLIIAGGLESRFRFMITVA